MVVVAAGPAEAIERVRPLLEAIAIIKLIGSKSNRDGIGAMMSVDGQYNHMTSAVGYASSSHFGTHFGLGKKRRASKIEIHWPSGIVQVLRDVPANQVLTVHETAR